MTTDYTPWRVKKLEDDSFAYLVPDANIAVDGDKMCVQVVVSTPKMDRERDILIAKGCRTEDHEKIPAVLVSHKKQWPAVAQTRDPNGRYTVKCVGDELHATTWFHETSKHSKLAAQTFRLIDSGALRGVSPGFLTVPNGVHKVKGTDGGDAFMYTEWNLVEISHVPIPMNPDAIVLAVEKGFGGESLVPELKELLLPHVPPLKPQVTSGWVEKSAAELLDELDEGDADLADADLPSLTQSTAFYHAVHEKAFDMLGMVKELGDIQELESTQAAARDIVASIGRVLEICRTKHADHLGDFPGQPGLPGGVNANVASKKSAEWRVKAMEMWDEYKQGQQKAVAEECARDIVETAKFLSTIAGDLTMKTTLRAGAKRLAVKLGHVKMVAVPADDDEEREWGAVAAKLDKALTGAA